MMKERIPRDIEHLPFPVSLNQNADPGFSRIFGLPKGRVAANFDLYNVGNAKAVLVQNGRFGPAWQNAIQVMPGRLMKFSARYDFSESERRMR